MKSKSLFAFPVLVALLLSSVSVVLAQVYGVHRRTAVVSGPNRTVVAHQTTVVHEAAAYPWLPRSACRVVLVPSTFPGRVLHVAAFTTGRKFTAVARFTSCPI